MLHKKYLWGILC